VKVLVLHTLPLHTAAPDRTVGKFDLDTAAGNVAGALPDAVVAGVLSKLPICGISESAWPG